MNILFIADQYKTGGAADALVEMATLLQNDYNSDITVLTGHKNELGNRLSSERLNYLFCGYRQFSFTKQNRGKWRFIHKALRPLYIFLYYIYNLKALSIARKSIDFKTIDIIHSNVNRNDFGALLSTKYSIPHIWQLRECPTGHFVLGFNRVHPAEYMNKNTTRFIAISEFVKGEWVGFGLDKDRIDVIYDGVDMSEIKEKEDYEKGKTVRIVCVGDITPQKGQHLSMQ